MKLFKLYKDEFGSRIFYDVLKVRKDKNKYLYLYDRDNNGRWTAGSDGHLYAEHEAPYSEAVGLEYVIRFVFETLRNK